MEVCPITSLLEHQQDCRCPAMNALHPIGHPPFSLRLDVVGDNGLQAWYPSLQEADDLVSPDALSTVREMDVANFRRVPRMPIYGTAQPSAKVPAPRPRSKHGGRGKASPGPDGPLSLRP